MEDNYPSTKLARSYSCKSLRLKSASKSNVFNRNRKVSKRRVKGSRKNRRNPHRGRSVPLEIESYGNDVKSFNGDQTLICKIPAVIVPKSVQLRLTFPDTTTVRIGTAQPATNWSIRTSAYDPDPSFGTGAMPGFTEWVTFFQSYRVHGIGVRGQIVNLEATAVYFLLLPNAGAQITNNTLSGAVCYEKGGNPLAVNYVLGPLTGGNEVLKINLFWNLTEVLGSTQWLTDDGYASNFNTNPATSIWLLAAAVVITGSNFVTGVGTHLNYDMDVEFYNRKELNS